jgi:hypothetical protein
MCLFMYLFMSNVLYSKIEIEIDTNNDELLETYGNILLILGK